MADTNYDFNFQQGLVSLLIASPDIFSRVRPIVKTEYFSDTMIPVVGYILEYSDSYKSIPTTHEIKMKTGVELPILDITPINEQSILDETEKFCRHRAIENVIINGVELVEKNQYGEIDRQLKDAMTISLITDLGADYFNTVQERRERIKNNDGMVSTGWKDLDHHLFGGFTEGSLNVFAGGSGSGKSLFLQNISLNWALAGLNVVYISLELSEDLVGNRIDAMLTGMGTKEIFHNSENMFYLFNKQVNAHKPAKLHIKKMPEAGTTCNDIRAYLKEYQIKYGIKPDALVVDYLDLLYPNNSSIDATNAFAKDKYVSEELRSIAGEYGIPSVSASQLNRGAVQEMEFDHSHIAGGISKINTADNVFGIFTSKRMQEIGEYELQFLKTRSSDATGKKMKLGYNDTSMRMSDHVNTDEIEEVADEDGVLHKVDASQRVSDIMKYVNNK